MIDIKGLDKAEVLSGLYNNSRVIGYGAMFVSDKDMTMEEARELLEHTTYFDYLHGKIMKVDLKSDIEFDERLYDRDNGKGSAERVIQKLRNNK